MKQTLTIATRIDSLSSAITGIVEKIYATSKWSTWLLANENQARFNLDASLKVLIEKLH